MGYLHGGGAHEGLDDVAVEVRHLDLLQQLRPERE
jgi:hypothetical protein